MNYTSQDIFDIQDIQDIIIDYKDQMEHPMRYNGVLSEITNCFNNIDDLVIDTKQNKSQLLFLTKDFICNQMRPRQYRRNFTNIIRNHRHYKLNIVLIDDIQDCRFDVKINFSSIDNKLKSLKKTTSYSRRQHPTWRRTDRVINILFN